MSGFRKSLLIQCLLLCFLTQSNCQSNHKYHAGLKVITLHDNGRNFFATNANFEPRPIIIFLWYPTDENKSEVMIPIQKLIQHPSFLAFGPRVVEDEPQNFKRAVDGYQWRGKISTDDLVKKINSQITSTQEEAMPSRGKFPLIIFGNGMNAGGHLYYKQCELLAEHGFASMVVVSKFLFRDSLPSFNEIGIKAQMEDVKLAFDYCVTQPFIDKANIALERWGSNSCSVTRQNPECKMLFKFRRWYYL
jgi:hypothetical protein